jgi:hypothetical protein
MTPIVNGLKEDFEEQVDFRLLDASWGEGEALFEHYGLLGHPSYVLLDTKGEERWRGIGPYSRVQLEDEVRTLIQE